MIMSSDIKIVMHKLMTRIILTMSLGMKSKIIVLKCTRVVKITTMVMIDRTIASMPEITEPFRVDWHRQHEFNSGFGILANLYS